MVILHIFSIWIFLHQITELPIYVYLSLILLCRRVYFGIALVLITLSWLSKWSASVILEKLCRLNRRTSRFVVLKLGCYLCAVQAGDATAEELSSVTQLTRPVLPIVKPQPTAEIVSITDEMKSQKGYYKLRLERMNERLVGVRKKKAEQAEKDEKK